MSRAFMKELEDAPEPKVIAAPRSRPMTPAGLRALRERLKRATDEQTRRALAEELEAATVVKPPEDRRVVAFGAHVTVVGDDGKERIFTIVGDAEMDVPGGKITEASPLGRALLGARAGARVVWKRPIGDLTLEIRSVRYD